MRCGKLHKKAQVCSFWAFLLVFSLVEAMKVWSGDHLFWAPWISVFPDANICNRGCKRLRPPLQTFASPFSSFLALVKCLLVSPRWILTHSESTYENQKVSRWIYSWAYSQKSVRAGLPRCLGIFRRRRGKGRHALTDSPLWRLTAEPYICSCITWNMGSFFQTTGNGQLTYFFVILHPEPYSPSVFICSC